MTIAEKLERIKDRINDATLVAVTKYSEDSEVREAYDAGHRDFGENKAQELDARKERFPEDVRWHFIGHLQRNKVKYIAPYVHLIHGVDSAKLLREIDKQARKNDRVIDCLLQVHIAEEESKFGLTHDAARELATAEETAKLQAVRIRGLMGMATHTENSQRVEEEFAGLADLYRSLGGADLPANVSMDILSMGMTDDYPIALKHGANLVRIGSAIFPQALKTW